MKKLSENTKPKMVCIHLLNDFSGSPLVFSQVIEGFVHQGHKVALHTNHSKGFLSNIKGVDYHLFNYNWSKYKILTLLKFFLCQLVLMVKMLKYVRKDVVFYINTALPFGAALTGKLLGKKVIYHIHETSIKPAAFKYLLFGIADQTADAAIYVSDYLRTQEPLSYDSYTVYNALSENFVKKTKIDFVKEERQDFSVLMLCSLKRYKGIEEYVKLAEQLDRYKFELVLNAQWEQINEYFKDISIPQNMTLFDVQEDVHPFYRRADLLLNCSRPDMWVETFGMTALEGMAYGLPVVVPPVGGIAEVVVDKVSGFHIDCRDVVGLVESIHLLATHPTIYQTFSQKAQERANEFKIEHQQKQIAAIVAEVCGTNKEGQVKPAVLTS